MNFITNLPKKEPAVLLGTFFSLVAYVATQVSNAPSATTWATLGPVITTAVLRYFIDSPATVEQKVSDAHVEGKETAEQQVKVARSMAAQKAAETRALKTVEAPSVSEPSPKLRPTKRQKRKSIATPQTPKPRTSK